MSLMKEKPTFKKYNRSNLICISKYSFHEYSNIKKFNSISLTSKYPIFQRFYSDLNTFNNLNLQKESTKKKEATVKDNASKLCYEYCKALADAQKRKLHNKYDPINKIKYNYAWLENEYRLIQQEKVKKKNLQIYLTCHYQKLIK